MENTSHQEKRRKNWNALWRRWTKMSELWNDWDSITVYWNRLYLPNLCRILLRSPLYLTEVRFGKSASIRHSCSSHILQRTIIFYVCAGKSVTLLCVNCKFQIATRDLVENNARNQFATSTELLQITLQRISFLLASSFILARLQSPDKKKTLNNEYVWLRFVVIYKLSVSFKL